ncbi:HEAT repeat domain-containing protein [Aquimarina algicola]|uniref:HEAT repeat domain-containing protein n=1 Tax=Aquimarina algicola TaxID=2589995 RepID=A0A504JCJ5_9FLAO|nr:HEAT repeat domain-containing protein [Aquimarina algicola]TPN84639.1 hypothetical protein FHK87_17060 [Aquimarina algicola]
MNNVIEIINVLPTIISNGPNEETITILRNIGLSNDEVDEVLDIINQGIGRAGLYKMGMKQDQFTGYLDEHPVFQKTIDLILNSNIEFQTDTDGLHPKLKKGIENTVTKEVDLELLLSNFNNPDYDERAYALYDLIKYNHPNVRLLIEQSLFDKDEMVQITAIQGINENILDDDLIQKLIDLFQGTKNHTLVSNLTHVFSDFSLRESILSLVQKLTSDNLMIVYDCIVCLGEIGDKNVIDNLVPFKRIDEIAIVYDENGYVKQETGYTIGEIATRMIKKLNNTIKYG